MKEIINSNNWHSLIQRHLKDDLRQNKIKLSNAPSRKYVRHSDIQRFVNLLEKLEELEYNIVFYESATNSSVQIRVESLSDIRIS